MRYNRKYVPWRLCVFSVLMLLLPAARLAAASLRPSQPAAFFVVPSEPTELRWEVESGTVPEPIEFVVRDYVGTRVSAGHAVQETDGTLVIRQTWKQGFYDIEFPATDQRFGIVAIPNFSSDEDPFFCIDSALSWLVRDETTRDSLVRMLLRSGIHLSRERFSWTQINPDNGTWQWDGGSRYDTLRRSYAANGVALLEMCHDAPGWLGYVGKYPADLVRSAKSWQQISQHWRATWGALEVWNEPDIFFGANLPADQYVPLVRTLAYATAASAPTLPLIGGAVAHHNRAFLCNAARNELLENIDAFSFHTYGRASTMEKLVDDYRSWLTEYEHPSMPLWLTECGRPWPRGKDRPDTAADQISALDIVMKAVEARCCGVSRYFAFVYPFYEENDNNFGMMGRLATPLRSMAAYVRLTALLAHKSYLGDVQCDDPAVLRSRVFGDELETIAVLYTDRPGDSVTVSLKLPVLRAEGIDGRPLTLAGDEEIHVPDGLVYLWLDRQQIAHQLRSNTNAMRLWNVARKEPKLRTAPSPIVMRFEWDAEKLRAESDGYRVVGSLSDPLSLPIRLFNLADKPAQLTLQVRAQQVGRETLGSRTFTVPAQGSVVEISQAIVGDLFAADGRAQIHFIATDESGAVVSRLVVELLR